MLIDKYYIDTSVIIILLSLEIWDELPELKSSYSRGLPEFVSKMSNEKVNDLAIENYRILKSKLKNKTSFISPMVGEINRLLTKIQKGGGSFSKRIFQKALKYLTENFKEAKHELFSLNEIKDDLEIGFIDLSIIQYSQKNNLTIITNDSRTLIQKAKKYKVDFKFLREDIYNTELISQF